MSTEDIRPFKLPLSGSISLHATNVVASLRGKKARFAFDKKLGLFTATEGSQTVYFSDMQRGFWLYRKGISRRKDFIFSSYCLQNITFEKDDIVIDCGANAGDLFLKLKELISAENYIAIEPNPSDFRILSLNVDQKATLLNKALGKEDAKLKFFVATGSGDSSLVEPKVYSETIDVDVVRLETLLAELDKPKIKLLKIEAEGYEPEIIEGLGTRLSSCEYIAIDGGFERGTKGEQTFTTITNHLIKNGFEIVDIFFPWYRALFKRRSDA